MDVVISGPAKEYVAARGGQVFVRSHHYRCCSAGSTTMLDATTVAPDDLRGYETFACDGVSVSYAGDASGAPRELSIELRGRRRPRLEAYWDGCAFKI